MNRRISLVSPYTMPFYCGNSFLAERIRVGLEHRGYEARLFNSHRDDPREAVAFRPHLLHSLNGDRPTGWTDAFRSEHRTPWVITLTGTDYNSWCGTSDPPVHIRRNLEGADAVVVFNDEAREALRSCLPLLSGKLHVVPQGVEIAGAPEDRVALRAMLGIGSTSVVFLMVSSIRPVKNIGLALAAFRRIQATHSQARFLLAGPVLDADEAKRVLGEARSVEGFLYLGERAPREVRGVMRAADVFLNTSLNEGMPGAVLEAMAEGLPVLASDVPGNRSVVVHGANGFVFPLGDTAALAELMALLYLDGTMRRHIGAEGARTVVERYSLKSELEQYCRLYDGLLREDWDAPARA